MNVHQREVVRTVVQVSLTEKEADLLLKGLGLMSWLLRPQHTTDEGVQQVTKLLVELHRIRGGK